MTKSLSLGTKINDENQKLNHLATVKVWSL